MIGIQGLKEITRFDEVELRQTGKYTAWGFHLASLDELSLVDFKNRLSLQTVNQHKHTYHYQGIEINTKENQVFLNGLFMTTEYDRYDASYVKSKRNKNTSSKKYTFPLAKISKAVTNDASTYFLSSHNKNLDLYIQVHGAMKLVLNK